MHLSHNQLSSHPSTHVERERNEHMMSRLQAHRQPHQEGLALCHRVTLDSVAHQWVPKRTQTVHRCPNREGRGCPATTSTKTTTDKRQQDHDQSQDKRAFRNQVQTRTWKLTFLFIFSFFSFLLFFSIVFFSNVSFLPHFFSPFFWEGPCRGVLPCPFQKIDFAKARIKQVVCPFFPSHRFGLPFPSFFLFSLVSFIFHFSDYFKCYFFLFFVGIQTQLYSHPTLHEDLTTTGLAH